MSVVESSACPLSVRCQVEPDEQREVIKLLSLPPGASGWRGPACLLFHRRDERLENQNQRVIRGQLVEEDQVLLLRPSAFVTANGRRDTDRMPHAGPPLHLVRFMILGQRQARAYLRRRQEPWPAVDFAPMLRALQEIQPGPAQR